jgi:hypothetical protein
MQPFSPDSLFVCLNRASHVIVTNRHVAKIAEFGYVRRLAHNVEEYDR